MARRSRLTHFCHKYKIASALKVGFVVCAMIMFVTPLRNALMPGWPYMLRQLSTLKIIRVCLMDLVYYVDRSPYVGPCEFVHEHLANVNIPTLEDMPTYSMEEWKRPSAGVKPFLEKQHQAMLENYKPTLTKKEQREMLYAMFLTTQAFNVFNITCFLSAGSLIGYWRHHGLIPWDDDVDILFDREQWPLAREVLSCLPDLELSMGSDHMWKVYHKNADFWAGQGALKFPFIDIFIYNGDPDHVWPVCIWMKKKIFLPRAWVLPVAKGVFEGYPVYVPKKTADVLDFQFGHVDSDCYSRIFLRREQQLVPEKERTHLPCTALRGIYPFVVRRKVDKYSGTVIEERTVFSKVLSSFQAPYQGTLE